jgi:hypothetical protein
MTKLPQFKNKKFKIMLVGDPHCKPNDESKRELDIIKDYLELQYAAVWHEKPDLVILMGDNAEGETEEELRKTLLRITKPYADTGTPFAFILGNHDLECKVSDLKTQYAIYKALPGCVLPEDYTEFGDYELLIPNSAGSAPALHLLFVYSGGSAPKSDYGHYDHVKPEQNEWIRETCASAGRRFGRLPAVLVQHMPVQEEFALLDETSFLSMLTDGTYGQNEQRGRFYRLKKTTPGYMGEAPCPAAYNSGEFQAIKETRSIFAVFFGHDHMNDFIGMHEGVLMGQCKLSSFNAYGDGLMQGVRILEFEEDAPFCLRTRMLYYRDLLGDDCRSITGSTKTLRDRTAVKLEAATKTLGVLAALSLPLIIRKLIKRYR